MTDYIYMEESKTIPKWFQKHNTPTSTILVEHIWTDMGLLQIVEGKKTWYKVKEEDGLASLTEIEPQTPSIVFGKITFTRTYCDSNTFFNYWFDTCIDESIAYSISSKSASRLSKYKQAITNIDLGCIDLLLEDIKYY
jgi:hypothetical protein